jgi:hypothetical protein
LEGPSRQATSRDFTLEGDRVAFTVWEHKQREHDLNGDGDAGDHVARDGDVGVSPLRAGVADER